MNSLRPLFLSFLISIFLHAAFLFSDWRIGAKKATQGVQSKFEVKLLGAQMAAEKGMAAPDLLSSQVMAESDTEPAKAERKHIEQEGVTSKSEMLPDAAVKNPPLEQEGAQTVKDGGATVFDGTILGVGEGPASHVEIDVEIYLGAERQFSGRARNVYSASDGLYSLIVEGVPDHPELPLQNPWRLDVSGRVRDNGLSPEMYSGSGALSRRFSGYVDKDGATTFSGRTPDGLLDGQSLLFQFMHMGTGRIDRLAIATPSSYLLFDGVRQGEVWVDVPSLGSIKTQKYLFTSQNSAETIEVWLLSEQRNLPLRIRRVFADGDVTEQLVTGLRVRQ